VEEITLQNFLLTHILTSIGMCFVRIERDLRDKNEGGKLEEVFVISQFCFLTVVACKGNNI
jgi:hypothetical protein